jgi:hypothetical protein
MNVIIQIIQLLIVFYVLFNFFAGIIGGIWLAILGQWGLIVSGVIYSIFMPWAYTIAMLPGFLFAMPIMYFKGKSLILEIIFALIASLYSNAIMVGWSFVVFYLFVITQEGNPIALFLWGYSTMLAPLSYMASKEDPNNYGASLGLLLAMISFIACAIIWYLQSPDTTYFIVLSGMACIFSLFSITMVYLMEKAEIEAKAQTTE